eukprot:2057446-Rhodomonas_salina.2
MAARVRLGPARTAGFPARCSRSECACQAGSLLPPPSSSLIAPAAPQATACTPPTPRGGAQGPRTGE